MNAGRIAAVVRRHLYGAINSPTRLIILAFWPIVDLVVWGLVTTFLRGAGTELPVPASFFLGGIFLWNLVFRTKNAVAFCLLEENWSRNLISVMASPVTPGEYLGGAVAFGLIQVLSTLALISVLAWAMFAFGVLALGPMLAVYAAVLIVFGISLALVVIARVLRIGYSADELTWVPAASLLPFCAVSTPSLAARLGADRRVVHAARARVELMRAISRARSGVGEHMDGDRARPGVPGGGVRVRTVDVRGVPSPRPDHLRYMSAVREQCRRLWIEKKEAEPASRRLREPETWYYGGVVVRRRRFQDRMPGKIRVPSKTPVEAGSRPSTWACGMGRFARSRISESSSVR